MGVHHGQNLVDGVLEVQHSRGLGQNLRGQWFDDMDAKDLSGLLFRNGLDEAAVSVQNGSFAMPANGNVPVYMSGLHQVERNVDISPCSVGICACLAMSSVHNGLGDFALQAR